MRKSDELIKSQKVCDAVRFNMLVEASPEQLESDRAKKIIQDAIDADNNLRAFECAAASLIERAKEVIEYRANQCRARYGRETCEGCHPEISTDCKTIKLLAEMEAL